MNSKGLQPDWLTDEWVRMYDFYDLNNHQLAKFEVMYLLF